LKTTLRQCCLAAMLACAGVSSIAAVSQAVITPGPDTPGYGHREDQFAGYDFVEHEFLFSGLAKKYKGSGTLGADGKWNVTVASSANPYTSVMIVRRPADPAKFNGIVIVEWLNVSTNYPLDVDWGMAHEAILREGYAYIGVNVQKVGVQGVQKLTQYGNRYASLSIPDDDISYDILSQAGQAVRDQSSLLFGGLTPQKIIASGHSQSAMRLVTYANAIQPVDKVFDGIFIHGRANTGTKLASSDNTPSTAALRSDTNVPIFLLQSEMDVAVQGGTSKQVDSNKVRHWEVAGSAHADQYLLDNIGLVSGREVGWTPPVCGSPYNAMPFYEAEIAAFNHLKNWMTTGIAPPTALARDRCAHRQVWPRQSDDRLPGLPGPVRLRGRWQHQLLCGQQAQVALPDARGLCRQVQGRCRCGPAQGLYPPGGLRQRAQAGAGGGHPSVMRGGGARPESSQQAADDRRAHTPGDPQQHDQAHVVADQRNTAEEVTRHHQPQ
jgi:hypothetical protein